MTGNMRYFERVSLAIRSYTPEHVDDDDVLWLQQPHLNDFAADFKLLLDEIVKVISPPVAL